MRVFHGMSRTENVPAGRVPGEQIGAEHARLIKSSPCAERSRVGRPTPP